MGLFSSKNVNETFEVQAEEYLLDGERIEHIYGVVLDFVCFTNKRVIFVDKKITSTEVAVYSIPYKKIEGISITKGKMMSLSNEIEIITKAKTHELKFLKGTDVLSIYKTLSKYILD